jgi:hypothetical protein
VRIELLPVDGAGATNNLLPGDLQVGEPLVTITIGNAEATKTVHRDGSAPTAADYKAALVTIHFGTNALTSALGLPSQDITVGDGKSVCILPQPLETCVTVASAGVDADGNPFADGASVQLFKGVNGGIDIATGRASTDGATFAAASLPQPATDLPRTGGNATLPLIGGALLCLALVTRRMTFGLR